MSILKKYIKSEFFWNVTTLMRGTLVAQAIPILLSPVITRIYSPLHFGIFTLFVSLVNIGAIIINGKLESTLFINSEEKHDDILQMLYTVQAFIFVLITVIFCVFLFFNWLDYYYLWLIPIAIFFAGWYVFIFALLSTQKQFKLIANGKMLKGLSIGIGSILLGLNGQLIFGLIYSFVFGQILEVIYLVHKTPTLTLTQPFSAFKNFGESFSLIKKYRKYPLIFLPAALLQRSTMEMPVFFMNRLVDEMAIGQFGLMKRIIAAPVGIVTRTLGDVIRQKIGLNIQKKNSNKSLLFKHLGITALTGIIPTVFLMLFSPFIFSFIFGEEWRTAGEYLQILAPLFLLQLMVNPLGAITLLNEKQEMAFLLHFGHFVLTFIAFYIGLVIMDSIKHALLLYTIVYCIKYLAELGINYYFATPRHRE